MPRPRARAPDWARDRGLLAGLATVVALAALDAGVRVQLTGGYAIGAVVASLFSSSRRTASVEAVAMVGMFASGLWNGDSRFVDRFVRACVCLVLAILPTYSAVPRERREAADRDP